MTASNTDVKAHRRFQNLDGSQINKDVLDLVRWKLGKKPRIDRAIDLPAPVVPNDGQAVARAERPALTWLGHATYLVQLGGLSILTDPMLSERMFAIRRLAPLGIAFDNLPPIDVVLVSHNHRDHMDAPSLLRLEQAASQRGVSAGRTLFIVPRGLLAWFKAKGFAHAVELGWYEHYDIGQVRITFVPSQHWSQRSALDRNTTLWGGFVVEDGTHRVYHSGDTAYFEGFKDIGRRVGAIDAAMLPIGAYEPRWFMGPQHIAPEDSVRAFIDLAARRMIAMHWGTFRLTDEALGEPPLLARSTAQNLGIEQDRLVIPAIGETLWL